MIEPILACGILMPDPASLRLVLLLLRSDGLLFDRNRLIHRHRQAVAADETEDEHDDECGRVLHKCWLRRWEYNRCGAFTAGRRRATMPAPRRRSFHDAVQTAHLRRARRRRAFHRLSPRWGRFRP